MLLDSSVNPSPAAGSDAATDSARLHPASGRCLAHHRLRRPWWGSTLPLAAALTAISGLLILAAVGGAGDSSSTDANVMNDYDSEALDGQAMMRRWLELQTHRVEQRDAELLASVTADNWPALQQQWREELRDMLGLLPWPERTPLQPEITGVLEQDGIVVERLHFQALPNLYVTANLYRPAEVDEPLPAILYVCGHSNQRADGISFGNKTGYQHHGSWFARNGYVCLMIDTLQLGEIEGIHHGTRRYNRWWWPSRGYTPAGVEAWFGIRALDYLETRAEVDAERIGMTGRSGGGAYSWWVAALDDRVAAAVPVAGITDMRDHIVHECIGGHCDCMYMVNHRGWDFARVAALVAPRALMIANTDRDPIFPLRGVVALHEQVAGVYRALDAEESLALHVTHGGHADTQPLQSGAFHWMEQHLKSADPMARIDLVARAEFDRTELRVFGAELPAGEVNTTIDETFVPAAATPPVPADDADWEALRDGWMRSLKADVFGGWPDDGDRDGAPGLEAVFDGTDDGVRLRAWDFVSEEPWRLRLWLAEGLDEDGDPREPQLVVLNAVGTPEEWAEFALMWEQGFAGAFEGLPGGADPGEAGTDGESTRRMLRQMPWAMAWVAPRGVGPTAWPDEEVLVRETRRSHYLLGHSLEGAQVWDLRRSIRVLRQVDGLSETSLWLQGSGVMAANLLYASLFEDDVHRLDLHDIPASHHDGPFYLQVLRIWDLPQAVAAAAERSRVVIYGKEAGDGFQWAAEAAESLEWDEKSLEFRPPVVASDASE